MPRNHCTATTTPLTGCNPVRGRKVRLDREDQRHHDVPDDYDHQIGREIIGAVVMQFLTAAGTGFVNLEEGAE